MRWKLVIVYCFKVIRVVSVSVVIYEFNVMFKKKKKEYIKCIYLKV